MLISIYTSIIYMTYFLDVFIRFNVRLYCIYIYSNKTSLQDRYERDVDVKR